MLFLGVLQDDDTIILTTTSQLSASQQCVLQYVMPIITKMERVSDNYNEDVIDQDNYEYCQVHFLPVYLSCNCLYTIIAFSNSFLLHSYGKLHFLPTLS